MRILIANDIAAGAGGVESYLAALVPALQAAGHTVALLHDLPVDAAAPVHIARDHVPCIGVRSEGLDAALQRIRRFAPDVCFCHNMGALDVDNALVGEWPVVKMLHGHFGTCVSARRAVAFPQVRACAREFGAACLLHYLPRRCGAANPRVMIDEYRWARRQAALFSRYDSMIVASAYMREACLRAGVAGERVTAIPLFAPLDVPPATRDGEAREIDVLMLGRLTALKGPDVLLRAIAEHTPSARVVIAGDGPERTRLERFADTHRLHVRFPGWVSGADRDALLRDARVVAVPSVWPEPFGLVGLEAGAFGTPAVAFDSGGIGEWLRDGVNGHLVHPSAGAEGFGRAIAAVLSDRDAWTRLSAGARATGGEFSVARHVRALVSVFNRAAACRHAGSEDPAHV